MGTDSYSLLFSLQTVLCSRTDPESVGNRSAACYLDAEGRSNQLLVGDGEVLWPCVSIVIYLEGLLIQALKLMTSIMLLVIFVLTSGAVG